MMERLRKFGFPALVALVAIFQYANTLGHDYVWDDHLVILENPYTQQGLDGLPEIWTNSVHIMNRNTWRPIVQTTFALEYEWFGNNPAIGHATNVLLFAALSLLVFFVLRALFPQRKPEFAFLAALLFAVHPLHSEVVANIKSRDEIMALLFGLLALWAMIRFAKAWNWAWFAGGLIAFVAALLCKLNALTLLPVFALAIYIRRQEIDWVKLALVSAFAACIVLGLVVYSEYLALCCLVPMGIYALRYKSEAKYLLLVFGWLAFLFEIYRYYLTPDETQNVITEPGVLNNVLYGAENFGQKAGTICLILWKYLQLHVVPWPLELFYGYKNVPVVAWYHPLALLGFAAYAAGGIVAVLLLPKRGPLAFGLAVYFCTLAIYSHIPVFAPDTMALRFTFMPSLGFCIVLATGWMSLEKWKRKSGKEDAKRFSTVATAVAAPVIVVFFFICAMRNADWETDESLARSAIAHSEENALAHTNLAKVLSLGLGSQPDAASFNALRDEVILHYKRAIEIYPDFIAARNVLGQLYLDLQMLEAAKSEFEACVQRAPEDPRAFYNLGKLAYGLQDYANTVRYYEQGMQLHPGLDPEAFRYLSWAYYYRGESEKATEVLERGANRYPENEQFLVLAAYFYQLSERYDAAVSAAERALARNPSNAKAVEIGLQSSLEAGDSTAYRRFRFFPE